MFVVGFLVIFLEIDKKKTNKSNEWIKLCTEMKSQK